MAEVWPCLALSDRARGLPDCLRTRAPRDPPDLPPSVWGALRGSQGRGFVSSNWFDRVLLPILHMFRPSC